MNSGDNDKSWEDLVSRANAESPRPVVDVGRIARRCLAEATVYPVRETAPSLLDELAGMIRGLWGVPFAAAASAAILILAWQTEPAIRDVATAIDLQQQLLEDF